MEFGNIWATHIGHMMCHSAPAAANATNVAARTVSVARHDASSTPMITTMSRRPSGSSAGPLAAEQKGSATGMAAVASATAADATATS